MFIIVATIINIVAPIIVIIFTKTGGVLKRLKCYYNDIGVSSTDSHIPPQGINQNGATVISLPKVNYN